MAEDGNYVPALRFRWLTRFYDPIVRVTTREHLFKSALIDRLDPAAGATVLDVGCGTGTLAIMLKARYPNILAVGVDGDGSILRIAHRKANAADAEIDFRVGLSTQLPFADQSVDHVFSSLFFHHLSPSAKRRSLEEIMRVLKPGGSIDVADWGKPSNRTMATLFMIVRCLDGWSNTDDNYNGRLPAIIEASGGRPVEIRAEFPTVFGTLAIYHSARI